jgi:hypothetical protein
MSGRIVSYILENICYAVCQREPYLFF